MVARHVVKLSDDDLRRVELIFAKLIKSRRLGMTAESRDRLRGLDEESLAKLYTLPDRLLARAESLTAVCLQSEPD